MPTNGYYLALLADLKIHLLRGETDEALALADEALSASCDCGAADDSGHRDYCDRAREAAAAK